MPLKISLFTALAIAGLTATAQTPFNTMDSVDANMLNVSVLVHGDMWWNPANGQAQCFFSNGSRKAFNFAGSLWMSAYDNSGGLHVAAQTYRQQGNDYWPGPLDANGSLDYATSEKWAKIWKVRNSDLETFNAITFHTVANTPEAILNWPAKGNAYAKGKDGTPLTVTEDMAPFIDKNGDGIYQPLKGDCPDIKGSAQALWWCFSDNGPSHTQSDGLPLKVQVHAMSYAYKRNTLIDQVVYYDYTVINKSANDYHDMRIALRNDARFKMNDFLGFDSIWRMSVVYSATEETGGPGHPLNSYGRDGMANAFTFVKLPGDAGGHYEPAGSFTFYNNDPSIIGKPVVDTQYDHYMRSKKRNGDHWQYGGRNVKYLYSDDPTVPGGFHECGMSNNPGDRSFILSSGDFTLPAGGRVKTVMAQILDTAVGGCPSIMTNGFAPLREVADTAWGNYRAAVGVPKVEKTWGSIKVYPNPTTNVLNIVLPQPAHAKISVYNGIGQRMDEQPLNGTTSIIDICHLPPGVYTIVCQTDERTDRAVFVKQ